MATLHSKRRKDGTPSNTDKPWRARVKLDCMEYFLGYYPTKEEAEDAEKRFKEYYRPNRK